VSVELQTHGIRFYSVLNLIAQYLSRSSAAGYDRRNYDIPTPLHHPLDFHLQTIQSLHPSSSPRLQKNRLSLCPLIALLHYLVFRHSLHAAVGAGVGVICIGPFLIIDDPLFGNALNSHGSMSSILGFIAIPATVVSGAHGMLKHNISSAKLLLNLAPIAAVDMACKSLIVDKFPSNAADVSTRNIMAVLLSGPIVSIWSLCQLLVVEHISALTVSFQPTIGISTDVRNADMVSW